MSKRKTKKVVNAAKGGYLTFSTTISDHVDHSRKWFDFWKILQKEHNILKASNSIFDIHLYAVLIVKNDKNQIQERFPVTVNVQTKAYEIEIRTREFNAHIHDQLIKALVTAKEKEYSIEVDILGEENQVVTTIRNCEYNSVNEYYRSIEMSTKSIPEPCSARERLVRTKMINSLV